MNQHKKAFEYLSRYRNQWIAECCEVDGNTVRRWMREKHIPEYQRDLVSELLEWKFDASDLKHPDHV